MFDFPHPFGPTTPVIPGSNSTLVLSAKDLKPTISSLFRRTHPPRKLGSTVGYQFVDSRANRPTTRCGAGPSGYYWLGVSVKTDTADLRTRPSAFNSQCLTH